MPGWQRESKSRHERGYGYEWTKTRAAILERDEGLCQVCLKEGVIYAADAVDHIVPKSLGGSDNPDNLRAICNMHHTAKTSEEGLAASGRTKQRIGADGWPVE